MTIDEAIKRIGTIVRTCDHGGRIRHGFLKSIDQDGYCWVVYPQYKTDDFLAVECLS